MTNASTQELIEKARERIRQTEKLVTETRRLKSETDALMRVCDDILSVPVYPLQPQPVNQRGDSAEGSESRLYSD